MKSLIVLLFIFILAGCTRERKITEKPETKKIDSDTLQKQDIQKPESKAPVKDTASQPESGLTNIRYGISKLPPSLKNYKGKIVAMVQWEDKLGANILFITETEEEASDDNRSKELFGYNYLVSGEDNELLWRINDFIKDCPIDLTLKFINKSLSITDLDNDGTAESSFLYRMSCKGDVSPDDMKLIMHEGKTKYALRGQMKLTIAGEGTYGGDFKVDPAFDEAPGEFLKHAKSEWNKYKNEKAGE